MRKIIIFLLLAIIAHAVPVQAVMYEGELSCGPYNSDGLNINSIRIKYVISSLLGEPLKRYHMWWEGSPETHITDIRFRAKVNSPASNNAYIFITPALIPKQGDWSDDVNGSPAWDNLFHDIQGNAISAEKAKDILKEGLNLSDLTIVSITGRKEKSTQDNGGYQKFHDMSKDLLGKVFKGRVNGAATEWENGGTDLGEFEKELESHAVGKLGGHNPITDTPIYGVLYNGTQEILYTRNIYPQTIGTRAYKVGEYYYVFIRTTPLRGYDCSNAQDIRSNDVPVDFAIKMELSIQNPWEQDKIAEKGFDASVQLITGGTMIFADRIKGAEKDFFEWSTTNNKLYVNVMVTPAPTKTCEEIKKEGKVEPNPFEEQVAKEEAQQRKDEEEKRKGEERQKLAELLKRAKDLGALNVASRNIRLLVWDHGEEDGDGVELKLNDVIIRRSLSLTKSGENIDLNLKKGLNILQITATDVGTTPPNTASFSIYENGTVLANKQWSLDLNEKGVLTFLVK